jgi:hypothetical protein
LFDLLSRHRENRQHLNHNLYDNVNHSWCLWNFCIGLEPFEKALNVFKDVDKSIMASSNVLGCLNHWFVMTGDVADSEDNHQEQDSNSSKDHLGGREYLEHEQSVAGFGRTNLSETYQANALGECSG